MTITKIYLLSLLIPYSGRKLKQLWFPPRLVTGHLIRCCISLATSVSETNNSNCINISNRCLRCMFTFKHQLTNKYTLHVILTIFTHTLCSFSCTINDSCIYNTADFRAEIWNPEFNICIVFVLLICFLGIKDQTLWSHLT